MNKEVKKILEENRRRTEEINALFEPLTGEGSVGERFLLELSDFSLPRQYLPVSMQDIPLIKQLQCAGSLQAFMASIDEENTPENREKLVEAFIRVRVLHDFPFWAALYVYIKNKGGGEDVLFRLTRPQRKFVERLEQLRLSNKPIRIVLLKARQWGGSTTSQLYMAWLQLVHQVGLNSLIISHQVVGSDEIKDMFDRMIQEYPVKMLHKLGESYKEKEPKLVGVGKSGAIHRVPQRKCKIKIGTAERPNSCRGGDYNLVHLSEVGIWVTTKGKTPAMIVGSACSGVPYKPYTMIIYESTAKGTGNFFQEEYDNAKRGISQFEPLFISWFDIDLYSLPFADDMEREKFATELWENRLNSNTPNSRSQSGKYLWYLWELGATLEAINWYIIERKGKPDYVTMASEYPSDDIEAFAHSGERVFDMYQVNDLKPGCRPPLEIGDVYADAISGEEALKNVRFSADRQGQVWIWAHPETFEDMRVTNRYLVVVDIGGRSKKADYSVIMVLDRYWMMEGGRPAVVAQWYGHIDMDLLAWKAAQIATYYHNALLVIESNTLETHDPNRSVDGDNSAYILTQIKDVYPNLYARRQSPEDILEGRERKYGFHTNVSTKPVIIGTLVRCIRERLYVERDVRCLDEYLTYERKENGAYGAISGKHDDLLMTRAIALHICFHEMDVPALVPIVREKRKRKKAVMASM